MLVSFRRVKLLQQVGNSCLSKPLFPSEFPWSPPAGWPGPAWAWPPPSPWPLPAAPSWPWRPRWLWHSWRGRSSAPPPAPGKDFEPPLPLGQRNSWIPKCPPQSKDITTAGNDQVDDTDPWINSINGVITAGIILQTKSLTDLMT